MAYVKVAFIAVLGAVGGVLLRVTAAVLPLIASMAGASPTSSGVGSTAIGSGSVLLAAVIGFLLAGVWAFTRFVVPA